MEFKKPKVTIYITTYNHAKYVEEAIKSVINQTYSSWELIIINDGSNDETEQILEHYEGKSNIKIVNQENKGLIISCNIALQLSQGKYIMRLDGDDHPNIGLVYPDYYLIDERGDIFSVERREKLNGRMDGVLDLPPHGACTMFRKKILIEMSGYDEDFTCQDGFDIWIRFIEKYNADNINLPLFYYRQHSESLTKKRNILKTRQKIKRKYAETREKRYNINEIRRLAIIPGRVHSDFILKISIQEVAGTPLINYTIREAIDSECFDKIVVVSEDDEILNYIKNEYSKIDIIKRPLKYARRNTGIEKTVKLVLDELNGKYQEEYDETMMLYVQNPLKTKDHIIKAIDTLHIFNVDSVISLCETISPYYFRDNNGIRRIGNKEHLRLERKKIYKGNGSLFLFKTENIFNGNIYGNKMGHILMPREESVSIISEFDFQVAEFLLNRRKDMLKSNHD